MSKTTDFVIENQNQAVEISELELKIIQLRNDAIAQKYKIRSMQLLIDRFAKYSKKEIQAGETSAHDSLKEWYKAKNGELKFFLTIFDRYIK